MVVIKMNKLKAENINFSYNDHQILSNLDFEMESNQVIGLFGDSGSGKSTLCKILTGFIKDYEGNVLINDKIHDKGYNPVQLIYQHPEKIMNPRWKMEDVLKESWMPSDNILDEFGIKKEWFIRYPSELSGGELQRFSILRALNPKTKFIIADEITTMLDAVTQIQIITSLLKQCKENGIGLLLVSHDKKLLKRVCDKIVYLSDITD
jgi:peptide/nickel transport system ATP-binding protein